MILNNTSNLQKNQSIKEYAIDWLKSNGSSYQVNQSSNFYRVTTSGDVISDDGFYYIYVEDSNEVELYFSIFYDGSGSFASEFSGYSDYLDVSVSPDFSVSFTAGIQNPPDIGYTFYYMPGATFIFTDMN